MSEDCTISSTRGVCRAYRGMTVRTVSRGNVSFFSDNPTVARDATTRAADGNQP
jgi:hypothetical protein